MFYCANRKACRGYLLTTTCLLSLREITDFLKNALLFERVIFLSMLTPLSYLGANYL